MAYLVLYVIGAAVLALCLLGRYLTLPHDAREPPLVAPSIPFVGHIYGMLNHGSGYYSMIAKECKQPIFTLGLPRAKMYIVASPNLVSACDRRSKIVSFAPYVVDFAKRVLVASQPSIDLLSEDLLEENGPVTLRPSTMKAMHQSLMPGESLDETTAAVLKHMLAFLDSAGELNDPKGVPLFQFVRQLVTIGSTNAIYGPEKNPFRDLEVLEGFWAVDRDFALLGLMVLPELIAPKGSRGRERFFRAFREYYAAGGLETASRLIKARHAVNTKHGVSDQDIAQFDLGVCTALLVNTVPAICWTLCHVFSHPTLLAELRQGVESIVLQQAKPGVPATVNISKIAQSFPLLESVVKEVLRVQSNNASARLLLKDTLIDDGNGATYLLKKDSFLLMPSAPVHNSEEAWGPTAKSFNPERFLGKQKASSSIWRTFGGGNALCPGRHFAVHEIVSVLVVALLRYDVEPTEGVWTLPKTRNHISTSILTPVKDIWVRIRPREETREIDWRFVWEPEQKVPDVP
ncbi:cytochrome P450 [Thozetella sp. PMI_491]|nr:cytochrome P450 [Thozetella sp. PMI_491]